MRKIFEIYELSPKVIYEVKNVETAFRLAAAGFGLTIVPEICLKFLSFQAAPHYYQIGNPPLERHVVCLLYTSCPFRYIFATSSESFPIFATSSKCVITLTPSSVSGKP